MKTNYRLQIPREVQGIGLGILTKIPVNAYVLIDRAENYPANGVLLTPNDALISAGVVYEERERDSPEEYNTFFGDQFANNNIERSL